MNAITMLDKKPVNSMIILVHIRMTVPSHESLEMNHLTADDKDHMATLEIALLLAHRRIEGNTRIQITVFSTLGYQTTPSNSNPINFLK